MTVANDNRRQLIGAELVPGGILPTDHWHRIINDNTCSRCRAAVPDDDVPLMLWRNDGHDMLIYCEACCGVQPSPEFDDDDPA